MIYRHWILQADIKWKTSPHTCLVSTVAEEVYLWSRLEADGERCVAMVTSDSWERCNNNR